MEYTKKGFSFQPFWPDEGATVCLADESKLFKIMFAKSSMAKTKRVKREKRKASDTASSITQIKDAKVRAKASGVLKAVGAMQNMTRYTTPMGH